MNNYDHPETQDNHKNSQKFITFCINEADYEKIKAIAEKEESSVSRIIRLAIKKYLSEYYAQDKQQG
jgi:metal-responsive CopG/Arc/MetJ family transcriptional regulator